MDILSVDRGGELGILVEPGLPGAPVVGALPALGQSLDVLQRNTIGPADLGKLVGPTSTGKPGVQVVQVRLGDLNSEWLDLGVGTVVNRHNRCSFRLVGLPPTGWRP